MFQLIGLGACGGRITKLFEEYSSNLKTIPKPIYLNYDEFDMMDVKDIPSNRKCLLEGKGTGRSPEKGEKFAKLNNNKIHEFLEKRITGKEGNKENLNIVVFGAGGGSGSGLAPTVIEYLHSKDHKVGILMTIPREDSDLLENKNSMLTLNKMLNMKDMIKPFIIANNEYLLEFNGPNNHDYWHNVNDHIVECLLGVANIFNDDDHTETGRGQSTLDKGELFRIFQTEGFLDIKVMKIVESALVKERTPEEDEAYLNKFKEIFKNVSLSGNYKLSDTLSYGLAAIAGTGFNRLDRIDTIYSEVAKMAKGAAIRRTGTILRSDSKMTEDDSRNNLSNLVSLVMIAGGYKLPNSLNKRIKKIRRDTDKYTKTKAKESKVELTDEIAGGFGDDDFDF